MKIKLLVDVGAYKAGYVADAPDLVFNAVDGWQFIKAHEYELIPEEPRTTLSRRDEFAKAALSGLLSNVNRSGSLTSMAEGAVMFTDALLAELDKGKV